MAAAQDTDPRIGLGAGWLDAEQAASNMELLSHHDRPPGFYNPDNFAQGGFATTDLAFRDDLAFVGSFAGFNIFDISDPTDLVLRTSVVCPGGQGDLSIYGDLLFMSVEETRGRIDCGTQGAGGTVNPDRFRGVRIFDVSDLDNPVQVAAVQSCRGSHTHTIVTSPEVDDKIWVYISGTAGVRSSGELAMCSAGGQSDPNDARWRIDIIEVPLGAPEDAEIVTRPRLFSDGGAHNQLGSNTNHCHDITAYPEIGLAAGACQGNGLLIDISDPANPVRLEHVADPNFAYWHSATFNNDGTKVVFTDEWGGGTNPRCRPQDPMHWGANGIYDIVDGRLEFRSYYKLPVPQTPQENCVAHNGSLVPVPNRDVLVQAWYQGGISVLDFTDSSNPVEIAFFDRGPVSPSSLVLGGFWSAYWYNGHVYGSEISRGFDSFALTPSEHLSQNELDVAASATFDEFNAQLQPELVYEASFSLARANIDQVARAASLDAETLAKVTEFVDRAEQFSPGPQRRAAIATLRAIAGEIEDEHDEPALVASLRGLADSLD